MAKRKNTLTRFFEDIVDDTKDFVDDLLDRAKDLETDVRDSVKDVVDDDDDASGDVASLKAHLAALQAKVEELTALQASASKN
jgi:polyhydroxyalkanoate synthesis regulator phasin